MQSEYSLQTIGKPERLAYSAAETCAVINVSSTTLWRLDQRGLLKPVPGIRHRRYSKKAIEQFLNGGQRA